MTANKAPARGNDYGTPALSDSIEGYAVDVAANIASVEAIDFRGWRGGEIIMRSGSTATITIYSSPTEDGAFCAKKAAGTALTITIDDTSTAYELPPELFGSNFLKLIGDAAGSFDIGLKA